MERIRLVVGCLILSAASLLAQSTAAPPSEDAAPLTSFRVHSTVVLVPTLVRNESGKPVYTLQASDFTLTDDGQPQTLHLDEETSRQPLALVLVLQTGGVAERHLEELDKLSTMLDAVIGDVPHRVALISYDSTPHLVHDFTANTTPIRDAIKSLPAGDDGAALLDALSLAVGRLRDQPTGYRRVILMVGETLDHGSRISMDSAVQSITATNTAIYGIAFSSTRAHASKEFSQMMKNDQPGPANGCMGHDPGTEPTHGKKRAEQAWGCLNLLAPPLRAAQAALIAGINAMQQNAAESVARFSGGEYFRFKDATTLERDLTAISNHLPNRYLLSFQPQSPHPGLHHIEVRLRDYPQLTVLARANYWADDDKASRP